MPRDIGRAFASWALGLDFVGLVRMGTSIQLRKRAAIFAVGLGLSLLGVRSSDASTISWQYTGSVVASFNTTLVPTGSPATIVLTLDPANNFALGAPGVLPSAGGYYFDATIDFTGREYLLHGAFEVNEDLVFDHPLPGEILERYLSLTGPSLDPSVPPPVFAPYPGSICGLPCGYDYPASANVTSPALPVPLPVASFSLFFMNLDGQPAAISVSGTNPEVVPEPASGLLLLTGAIMLVRWSRRRASA